MFLGIVVLIVFLQILLITFAGRAFYCYIEIDSSVGGLTALQWLISIGFGMLGLVMNFLLKLIPDKKFLEVGNKETDPTKNHSLVMSIKRQDRENSIARRNSSIVHFGENHPSANIGKVPPH